MDIFGNFQLGYQQLGFCLSLSCFRWRCRTELCIKHNQKDQTWSLICLCSTRALLSDAASPAAPTMPCWFYLPCFSAVMVILLICHTWALYFLLVSDQLPGAASYIGALSPQSALYAMCHHISPSGSVGFMGEQFFSIFKTRNVGL